MKNIYYTIIVLVVCYNTSFGQNRHVLGKAELLGVVNDTAFIARSSKCDMNYETVSSDLTIEIPITSFLDGHYKIDSTFNSYDNTKIVLSGNLGVNIFDLFEEENTEREFLFSGTLSFEDREQFIEVKARAYKTFTPYNGNSNLGSMMLDFTMFFNPSLLNEKSKFFENPLELIIQAIIVG